NNAEAKAGRVAMVQVVLPPLVVHVNAGPELCVSDTSAVLLGAATVKDTDWASSGPLLETNTRYLTLAPGLSGIGIDSKTERSTAAAAGFQTTNRAIA